MFSRIEADKHRRPPDFRRIELDAQQKQQATPVRTPEFARVRRAVERDAETPDTSEINYITSSRNLFRKVFFASIVSVVFMASGFSIFLYAKTDEDSPNGAAFESVKPRPVEVDIAEIEPAAETAPVSAGDRELPPADNTRPAGTTRGVDVTLPAGNDDQAKSEGSAEGRQLNAAKATTGVATAGAEKVPTENGKSTFDGEPGETASRQTQTQTQRQGEPSAESEFFVQLASYQDRERARTGWRDLKERFAELGQHGPVVVVGEVGEERVHRLRAGPFHALAEANAICQEVRRRQGDCFVVQG